MESVLVHTLRQAAALRRKWQERQTASFLGWHSIADPAVAEIQVEWGYDGLIIDTEQSTFGAPGLRSSLLAFRGTDCVPIVRVGANDPYLIKTALDLGAAGVLVPLIQNADDAHAAVRACRYAPQGERGVSPRRASNYFRDFETYLREANDSILVMIQIECAEAYENLDAILQVDGIDCLFIGPADLSATLKHIGDTGHPEVTKVIEDIISRCGHAGRPVAIASAPLTAPIKRWVDMGVNVVACGSDLNFLRNGFAAFESEMRKAGLPFGRTP